jgi:Tfp pilus assembly protein PilV
MRTVKATLRDSAGMTVVEVIIALGIITIGLLALIGAMPLSTSLIGESNLQTTATFLAQQRLEQIKNATWSFTTPPDKLGGAGSDGSAPVAEWADEAAVASYPQFQRQVRICQCDLCVARALDPADPAKTTQPCGLPTNPKEVRQVKVTVSVARMTGPGTFDSGALESVQLVTFIAQRP